MGRPDRADVCRVATEYVFPLTLPYCRITAENGRTVPVEAPKYYGYGGRTVTARHRNTRKRANVSTQKYMYKKDFVHFVHKN